MKDSVIWKIKLMAMNGFFASTICKKLKKGGWADLSPGQIYHVLKGEGISLLAYRQGWGDAADIAFKRIKLPGTLPEVKRKRRRGISRRKPRLQAA